MMPSRKGDPSDWVLKLAAPGNCSMGLSNNETINYDGSASQERENEDRSLMCLHNDKQLLMVLDGHEGSKAVKFVHTHLPHILLKSDFSGDERSVMKVISSAILSTETNFFVSIDPYITRKVTLQIEIEQEVPDMNSSAAANLFPTQIAEIGRLDDLIKSGTTVVLALIIYNRLFVANVGDSRALLCLHQPGREGALVVQQLTVDHNTKNEGELHRLEKCGLNPRGLQKSGRLGTQQNTRSIGDYSIKGGYHNLDILKHATSEPGTAEPYIHGPIDVSTCQGFLILMSDGLYKAYEEWSGRPDRINDDLAHLVAKELKNCRGEDESMVAQNVVEKVKHLFRDTRKRTRTPGRLDDITLIIKRLGLSHSQSVSPVQQVYYSVAGSVPQSAPVTDMKFDFNGRPVSATLQPSHPSTSYHQPYSQQHPPPPFHQPLPPVSSYQPSAFQPQTMRGNYDDYGSPQGMQAGAGNYVYSRQQAVQPGGGMQPRADNNQYHEGQYRHNPQGNYPPSSEQGRGFTYQSTSMQGPQSNLQESQYNRQDPSARQVDGRYPQDGYSGQNPVEGRYPPGGHGQTPSRQQQQFGQTNTTGQQFQGDSHQSRMPTLNYASGGASQQSYQYDDRQSSNQSTLQDTSSGDGSSSFGYGSSADDVATPVATPRSYFGSRQQSTSSFTSDTSSSSDLTLMRAPGMAAVDEVDTLREEDMVTGQGRANNRQPVLQEEGESGGGTSLTTDSEGPRTQDSEGPHTVMYLPDDDTEDEEEMDNEGLDDKPDSDGCLKPYVKFGDRFPADLSWFEIPPPEY